MLNLLLPLLKRAERRLTTPAAWSSAWPRPSPRSTPWPSPGPGTAGPPEPVAPGRPRSPPTIGSTSPTGWSRRTGRPGRSCGRGRSRWRPGRRRPGRCASSTATTTRATPSGSAAGSPGWSTGPAGRGGRRRSTWATCGSTWPPTSAWSWPTASWPPTGP